MRPHTDPIRETFQSDFSRKGRRAPEAERGCDALLNCALAQAGEWSLKWHVRSGCARKERVARWILKVGCQILSTCSDQRAKPANSIVPLREGDTDSETGRAMVAVHGRGTQLGRASFFDLRLQPSTARVARSQQRRGVWRASSSASLYGELLGHNASSNP